MKVIIFNYKPTAAVIYIIWRPPSLSGLTPMIFNMGLTHLASEGSNRDSLMDLLLVVNSNCA